jgi:hypothetical protein
MNDDWTNSWRRRRSRGRLYERIRRRAVFRSCTTFWAPTTQMTLRAPEAYGASWLPLAEATTRWPSSVTACTLPTTTSGAAPSRMTACTSSPRSPVSARTEANFPESSMSAAMPDSRSVSLDAVKTLLSRGSRPETRPRASETVSISSGTTVCTDMLIPGSQRRF